MSIAKGEAGRFGRHGIRGTGVSGVVAVLAALALAGCGGGLGGAGDVGPMGGGNADGQGNFGSAMETTTVAATPESSGRFADSEFTCPKVEVRGGASTWQVTDKTDGSLRYQATLARFSRECRFTTPEMNMRIGIQGRVLLGARGGAGSLNVPIRVAVVEEGPTPTPVWTKLYMVPVQIGAEVTQVDFSMVAEDVNFARPQPGILERYIVYVGFDSQAGEAEAARQRPRPRQAAPRPAAPQAAAPQAAPRQTAPRQQQAAPAQPAPARTAPAQAAAPAQTAPRPAAAQQPAASGNQWIGAPAATAPSGAAPARQAPTAQDNSQWIGSPAPAAGGFMTPTQ